MPASSHRCCGTEERNQQGRNAGGEARLLLHFRRQRNERLAPSNCLCSPSAPFVQLLSPQSAPLPHATPVPPASAPPHL